MNLCGGRVAGSMIVPSSIPTRKPDQFPVGLRVLVVDDDPTCLLVLERMLQSCQYEVTKCDRAEYALNELRRNKNGFDVVISDVHMPDMDGFKLLEHIGLEMDLPVIMMSADDGKDVVMKGVIHGACDYLIKPVRMEALKNIWQHVVRKKKKKEWKDVEQQSGSLEEGDKSQKLEDGEHSSPMSDGKCSKRKVDDEDADEKDDASTMKKARVVWSVDLHQQFVAAVNHLGIEKAFPKKILDLMNVPGLTRENVASHLQKYRLYLRRLSGVSHHPGLLSSPFMMSPQDPRFGTISPLGGIDLQTFAAGQLRGPTLAGYQPGLSRSTIRPGASPTPFIDQTNLFNPGNPKSRFGVMQSPMRHTVSPTGISPRTRIADSSQAMSFCAASQAYDTFNQLPQHTSAVANNSDVSPSILLNNQGFSFAGNTTAVSPPNYPCHFGDDDLSAFLKQQQGTGSVEGEFDIDVCILDNIPV